MEFTSKDVDIASVFSKGLQAHNEGDLSMAERLYKETLTIQPDHCEANHNIGVVLVAKNELDKALGFFKFALDASPNVSLFWASYIDALIKLERITESKVLIKALKDAGISCENIEAISHRLNVEYQEPGPKESEVPDELVAQQKFDDAIKACLSLMETYPSSAILNITLGKCYFELGQMEPAISSYEKATEYQPKWTVSFVMLAQIYSSQGDASQAIENLKRAIALQPEDPEINSTLGIELLQNGDLDEAVEYLEKTLTQDPNSTSTLTMLGNAYNKKGDYKLAISYYKQVLELDPSEAVSHYNMGNALQADGLFDTAIKHYKKALKINPNDIDTYNNMAVTLQNQGKPKDAIKIYKKALKIDASLTETYYNLGNALRAEGERQAAIESYKQAIEVDADWADPHINLGMTLCDMGNTDAGLESCHRALEIDPTSTAAHTNVGIIMKIKGDPRAAIESFRKAIEIDFNCEDAHYSLGLEFQEMRELVAAIESFNNALIDNNKHEVVLISRLNCQAQICDWAAIERDRHLIPDLGTLTKSIEPFAAMFLEDAPERHLLRSKLYAKNSFKQKSIPLPTGPTHKPKRVRIGYFSSDFRDHSATWAILNILEAHDRERFEIYAYSFGPDDSGPMRKEIIKAVDTFVDVQDMTDRDVALLAREDKIDIAIDLNGYTKFSRPSIFAYRAAPIQIHFWSSANSSGTDYIDYYIGDTVNLPKENDHHYSESIIRLPHWYQAVYSKSQFTSNPPTRADMGLPEDGFVFCCFNNSYKLSPVEFKIWMRLLDKVEGSVLWLLNLNKWMKQNLQKEAVKQGISPDRLIFAEPIPHHEHLMRHRLADLFIDNFNTNAGVTAGDALWVGLPIVTKLGNGLAARICGSLLVSLDMPELVTKTEQEYEALILELATNPERLATIRQKLTENRLSTALFDTESFTKHLEDGYNQAYQLYFDGKKPEAITVHKKD